MENEPIKATKEQILEAQAALDWVRAAHEALQKALTAAPDLHFIAVAASGIGDRVTEAGRYLGHKLAAAQ